MINSQPKKAIRKDSKNIDILAGAERPDTGKERATEDALEDDDVREALKRLHKYEK